MYSQWGCSSLTTCIAPIVPHFKCYKVQSKLPDGLYFQYAPADTRVIACLVGCWSPQLYYSSLFTLRREKHVPQADRLADYHGPVWLFCPCRVREFSVSLLPNLC